MAVVSKVVVIGHGYTSRLGVIRSLGKEGYEVIVIVIARFRRFRKSLDTTKPIDCYSKYVSRILYCPSDEERLVKVLLSECADPPQKVVIIPDSDFSASVIDNNADQLRDYFLFPHINYKSGEIVAWMDKLRQKDLAASVGLNVARGWRVDVVNGSYILPSEIKFPCFPKPLATVVGGKNGLRRCDSEEDLKEVIARLIKRNPTISILVEEFKEIDVEHALLGVADSKEVIIPGIIRTISLANGGHYGVAKHGEIMPIAGYEDLIDKFKKLILTIGFVGIFDIDFYQSECKFFFCEINFRFGGSGYAYTAMNVNLPAHFVRIISGEELSKPLCAITDRREFINERMCKEDWYEGFINKNALRDLLRKDCIKFIDDDEDKMPQSIFLRSFWNVEMNLKRIVKKLMK